MKYLLSIFLSLFISLSSADDFNTLKTPFDEHNDIIKFEFDKPIEGIQISGTFDPLIWDCMGTFKGTVNLNFTRVKDNKFFNLSLDKVSFFSSNICIEPVDYEVGCKFKNNIIIKYNEPKDFIDDQPLKFFDIDFDNKKELVFLRACGIRHLDEFEAYDLINSEEKFDIERKQLLLANEEEEESLYGPRNNSFYFRGNSKFDLKNKLVTIDLPWASCGNERKIYRSDGQGYTLVKKIITDIPTSDNEIKENLCETKTYIINSEGESKLTKVECVENKNSEWIKSSDC